MLGFVRLVTNRRIFESPLPASEALSRVDSRLAQPNVEILLPTSRHWPLLCTSGRASSDAKPRARPMLKQRILLPLLTIGLPLVSAVPLPRSDAVAASYRYVDEQGRTVYSQTPPPGQEAERLRLDPGPPPGETEAARQRLKGQLERDLDQRWEEDRAAEEQAAAATRARQRAETCSAARKNLKTLQTLGARMLRLPDGEVIRVGEDEREEMMDEARRQMEDNCD
jgi:hypothetical protein